MSDLTDEQIVNLVLNGGKDRYREIVTRYNSRIYSIGMRMLRNEDDAVDFTQEVFIRAYSKLHLYRFLSPFSHWLVRMAYNLGINMAKSRRQESDIDSIDVRGRTDHEADRHRIEITEVLNEAIRTLPPEYRICVDLFFFWDMKLAEIASITDIPLNTVKSNVRRAKMILRDRLKGTIAEDYHEL